MKKILIITTAAFLCVGLSACVTAPKEPSSTDNSSTAKPSVDEGNTFGNSTEKPTETIEAPIAVVVNGLDGWTEAATPEPTSTTVIKNLTSPSGCSLTVISQLLPAVRDSGSENELTKSLISSEAMISGVDSVETEPVTVKTNIGDVEFLRSTFAPTQYFNPDAEALSSPYETEQKRIMLAKIWNTNFNTTVDNTGPNDSDRDTTPSDAPATSVLTVYPQVMVNYQCDAGSFDEAEYDQAIASLDINVPFGQKK